LSVDPDQASATELSDPDAERPDGAVGAWVSPVTIALASPEAVLMLPAASSAVTR
jgi:hypothetical protein